MGLDVRAIAAVDAAGKDPTGAPVADLANGPALLKAAFASDIGVDNETLTLPKGGYQWFEVAKIDRARQKTFEEARPEVEKAWRDDENGKAAFGEKRRRYEASRRRRNDGRRRRLGGRP